MEPLVRCFLLVHLKDLSEFIAVYVNPKVRKMRLESYGVVAQYPECFPRLKNACLKWAWKQNTDKGWCPLPPNIGFRMSKDSKHCLRDFFEQVEKAMLVFSKIAAAKLVDRKKRQQGKRCHNKV